MKKVSDLQNVYMVYIVVHQNNGACFLDGMENIFNDCGLCRNKNESEKTLRLFHRDKVPMTEYFVLLSNCNERDTPEIWRPRRYYFRNI